MKPLKKYAVRTIGGLAFQIPKIWKKGRGKISLLLCCFTALSYYTQPLFSRISPVISLYISLHR